MTDGNLLGEAIVRITLDKSQLDSGTKDVKSRLQLMKAEAKTLGAIGSSFVGLSRSINRMFVMPALALATAGVVTFLKSGAASSRQLRESWSGLTDSVQQFLIRVGKVVNHGGRLEKIFENISSFLDRISPEMINSILNTAKWMAVVSLTARMYGWIAKSVGAMEALVVKMAKFGALRGAMGATSEAASGAAAGAAGAAGAGAAARAVTGAASGAAAASGLARLGAALGRLSIVATVVLVVFKAIEILFGKVISLGAVLKATMVGVGWVLSALNMALSLMARFVVLPIRGIQLMVTALIDGARRLWEGIKNVFKNPLRPVKGMSDAFKGYGDEVMAAATDPFKELLTGLMGDWTKMVTEMKGISSDELQAPEAVAKKGGDRFAFGELVNRVQESVLGKGVESAIKKLNADINKGNRDIIQELRGKSSPQPVGVFR